MTQSVNSLQHTVESIEISATYDRTFDYIADPTNLPSWTAAFKSYDSGSALMITPKGEATIRLKVVAAKAYGIIDWHMTFPDGSTSYAYSRVTMSPNGRCVYSFVLDAPSLPMEALEGTLASMKKTLQNELQHLKRNLEN